MPRITKKLLNSLEATASEQIVWDDALKGFGVRLKPSGAGSFIIQYRNAQGRSRRFTLGRMGVLTADQARAEARLRLADVARGEDPAEGRLFAREDLTVAELVELYLTEGPKAKPEKKASSWTTDRSNIRRHILPLLARRQIASLTITDIQRFPRDVTAGRTSARERTKLRGLATVTGGPGTASRATAVLSAILAFGVSAGVVAQNAAKGVKLDKLKRRERFLSSEEWARLGIALRRAKERGASQKALAIIFLLMLTGCRKNEIQSLKWSYVDFDHAALRLPYSKTGAKVVPLGGPALEILNQLRLAAVTDWVFPAGTAAEHYTGTPKIWQSVRKDAGLLDVRLHDLRHAFASMAVANGASLFIVGKVLGHTQATTTARYSHLDLTPMRYVADETSQRIAAAIIGNGSIDLSCQSQTAPMSANKG